jgi:hypothetical protein
MYGEGVKVYLVVYRLQLPLDVIGSIAMVNTYIYIS